jgi:hypothetical protein
LRSRRADRQVRLLFNSFFGDPFGKAPDESGSKGGIGSSRMLSSHGVA